MTETEWYVVTLYGEIVTCITTSQGRASAQEVADRMVDGPYTLTDKPTMAQLQRYRYWTERP